MAARAASPEGLSPFGQTHAEQMGSQLGATPHRAEALDAPEEDQPYRSLEASQSEGLSPDVRLSPANSPFRLPQLASISAGLELGGPSALHRWGDQPADPFEVAVVWIRKAKKGSVQWVDECSKSQFMHYRLFKKMKPPTRVIKMIFLCLAFFETPSWCLTDTIDCAGDRPGMMAFMLPVMPIAVGNYLEIACLVWFLARMYIRKKALGAAYACVRWRLFGLITLSLALLDCCVSVFNLVGIVPGTFRLARLCRPFVLLSFTKPLREVAMHVARCIPKVGDVLLSLALAFVGSVVAGLVLFANTAEGEQRFKSWDEAFASLWILFTTANFPDVMIPAINDRRSNFLFFLAYLVLTLFLLSNILLAAVYNAYKIQLKASVRVKQTNRFHSLRKAFQQIANDQGELSKNDWMRFFALYTRGVTAAGGPDAGCSESPESEARLAIDQRSLAILDLLDVSGSLRGMQFHEFKRGMDALLSKYVYFPRSVAPWLTHPHRFGCLRSFIENKVRVGRLVLTWDVALDVVIFADLIGMVVRIISFVSLDFKEQLEHRDLAFYLWFVVSLLYIADTWLKIMVFGRERFWYRSPTFYRFDFVCAHMVLLVEGFFLFNSRPVYGRSVVLVRLMRTCRLLRYITALRNLYSLLTRLLPTYLQLAALLFLVFYIFATLGVQLFGGLIFESNKSLVGSDFANGDYWALNFNDFPSGLMTLFVVMVVNNWYIIADGFNRAAGTNAACLFFVVFFIVTNLIVLNIFVAFILECYLNLNDEHGFSRHTDQLLDGEEGPGTATGSFVQHSMSHSDEPVHSISFRRSSIPLLRARINANEMLRRVLLAEDEEFVDTTNWLARLETSSNVGRQNSQDASPGGSTIINGVSPRHPYQTSRPRRESAPASAYAR